MGKQYFEQASRGKTTWVFRPEELVLVIDEKDPLYDPRVHDRPDEALVSNIAYYGVKEPITVCRRDGQAVVVNGRQRVKAAIIANERLKSQGKQLIEIPAVAEEGEDDDLFGLMVSLNEQRRDDGPMAKAKKAKRMLDLNGGKTAPVCVAFGITTTTLANWMRVFETAPAVRKAVDAGEIGMTAASELAKIPREEQEKALEMAKAEAAKGNGTRDRRVSARKLAKAAGTAGPRMRSRREVEKRLKEKRLPPDYKAALQWVLGME